MIIIIVEKFSSKPKMRVKLTKIAGELDDTIGTKTTLTVECVHDVRYVCVCVCVCVQQVERFTAQISNT